MPLKVIERKGSPHLYIRGSVNGIAIFESTGETSRALANKYRLKREIELNARSVDEKLFIDAAISYIEAGGEKTYVEKINQALGEIPLASISQSLLDRVARQLFPTQSNASVKRWFYDPVSAILRHAAKRGMCPFMLIEKPKVKRPPPRWAEMDWFEVFWEECNPQLKVLTIMLPYTGMRISELLGLTWERINIKERWAYIPDTKNDLPRTVSLPDIVINALKEFRPKNASGKVFPWGKRHAANQAIRRAVEQINRNRDVPIPYLSTHKLGSHTYATWMRRYAKLDHAGLVATGRWKHHSSTFIYTHTVASEESRKSDLLPVPVQKDVQE